ncbi:hypothetical protein [Cellulosimicrobium funkei]|uniref:hypothetical protein n=1 Tax=Cellulosimicrobium funkei TaxID=264251 RepID=UPI003B82D30B
MDEVGDRRHTTFFEMLGNWSLGSADDCPATDVRAELGDRRLVLATSGDLCSDLCGDFFGVLDVVPKPPGDMLCVGAGHLREVSSAGQGSSCDVGNGTHDVAHDLGPTVHSRCSSVASCSTSASLRTPSGRVVAESSRTAEGPGPVGRRFCRLGLAGRSSTGSRVGPVLNGHR